MEKQLVIFDLAGEHFGIDISVVESIVKMQKITHLPRVPDYVEGIINLRGSVLPVIDLVKRFGIAAHDQTSETRIVVINMGTMKMGMIVDAVSEVLTFEESIIEPTPAIISSVDTEFITGIIKAEARLIILLDLASVLKLEEQKVPALMAQV